MTKRKQTLEDDGYYDPTPRTRYRYIYDPDPDPSPFPWVLVLIVGAVILWSQPNLLNNIIFMFNPDLAKLEAEKVKAQQDMWRAILIICIACMGVFALWLYLKSREKHKLPKRVIG